MSIKFVQAQPFKLSGSGASIGDTTILLQSMVGINGTNLTTTDIGDIGFGTLEPGNGVNEEAISFTGITQNANGTALLTGVKSVLFISPYTATTGLSKTHAGASTFILSNDAAFYGNIIDYVNNAVVGGGVPATTTVLGIVKMSTAPVSPGSPIAVGDNDTRIPTAGQSAALAGNGGTPGSGNKYVTETGLSVIATDVQNFETSGTWTKPSGSPKYVEIIAIGAGGGGGAINSSSSTSSGGAGGGGGARSLGFFSASLLGSTETVTVGTGGTGGTNPNSGSDGTATTFGAWLKAGGGLGGGAGSDSGNSVGGQGGSGMGMGSTTGAAASGGGASGGVGTNAAGGAGGSGYVNGAGGGGSGGGVNSTPNNGASGGAQNGRGTPISGGTGGTSSTIATAGAGTTPSNCTQYEPIGGAGGGGGGGATGGSHNGGAGGNGGKYGGGGGGGGQSVSASGGAGGNGANGFCQVVTYF